MKRMVWYVLAILIGIGALMRVDSLKGSIPVDISQVIYTPNNIQKKRYEQQLSDSQRSAYGSICKALDQYQAGEVTFTKSLNIEDLEMVTRTLQMGDKDYSYSYPPIAFTDDNIPVTYSPNNRPHQVDKVVLIFATEEERRRDGNTDFILETNDENNQVTNYKSFLEYMVLPEGVIERIQKIQSDTEKMITEVYQSAPQTNNLKQTLDYFQNWMRINMQYDETAGDNLLMGASNDSALLATNTSCITTGKGVCNGFASLYSRLCQLKGIDAYVVFGTQDDIKHAWVAIELEDGRTIYVDPTATVESKVVQDYYEHSQLVKQRYIMDPISARVVSDKEI